MENSVWHAFDFMALEGNGTVTKTKLKTLTGQIGTVLDISNAEAGLDEYRSTPYLTFDQYRYYLFKEVFSGLPANPGSGGQKAEGNDTTTATTNGKDTAPTGVVGGGISIKDQHSLEAKLDDVFWTLCKSHYLERDNPVFPDDCVFKLFRIFCMLGEMVENDEGQIEVVMAAAEVESVTHRFLTSLGRGTEWDAEEFDTIASVIGCFKFGIFTTVLESKYAKDVDEGGMREAIGDVHDYYVLDVLKKGFVSKKLDVLPAFREHYCVLQPHMLTLYAGASEKDKRAEIPINAQCRVESVPDSKSKSPLKKVPGGKHHSRFSLFADEKIYEFQACDHRTRLQWLGAFRSAIDHANELVRYQRAAMDKRRIARQEEKEDKEDEDIINNSELDQTKTQLEQEKLARVNAEVQAATLQRQRAIEEKKMKEMEKIREQLEKLLEEERQAKKDEEIVRTLQARILNEEWARRETLEKLQEDQKKMLEEERKKREAFEKLQIEKEKELKEAMSRVEEMEKERRKLDKQLDTALEKTKAANHGQEVLEAKIKIQEQEREAELDKETITSRMTTLAPSASFYVKNRTAGSDRPSYMPMRSASMRETSYSRSIRRSRARPSTNNSTLSVASPAHVGGAGPGSMISDVTSNTNIAIEEVNSNASGEE